MRADSWAIAERAAQLAIVLLTRRDDLTVTHAATDARVDFLINVGNPGKQTGRVFAVELKASALPQSVGAPEADSSELRLRPAWTSKLAQVSASHADLPFPLCLFFFTMTDDRGYYAWLRRPAVDPNTGGPILHTNKPTVLKLLTDHALDELIASVNEWYDKRTIGSTPTRVRSLPTKLAKSPPHARPRRRAKTA
jgi:hypothetical protein